MLFLFYDSGGGQKIRKIIIGLATVGAVAIFGTVFLAWYRWRAKQKGKKLHCCIYVTLPLPSLCHNTYLLTELDELLSINLRYVNLKRPKALEETLY